MNAPIDFASTPHQAGPRKIRCENRWTAAEDKILFAQVLKGWSPKCHRIPVSSLTPLKQTVARSAGDLWLLRCQEGTTNPAGRGTYRLPSDLLHAKVRPSFQMDPFPESWSTQRYAVGVCGPLAVLSSQPSITGRWTPAEDIALTAAVKAHGKHWFQVARMLGNGRTDDQCAKVRHYPVALGHI